MKEIRIIFHNDFFICVFKPPMVLSVPSRFKDQDRREVLGTSLQEMLNKIIYPIHRLDFEVSGLVLFALTTAAKKWGNKCFENKSILKIYKAQTEMNKDVLLPPIGHKLFWQNKIVRGKKRSFEAEHGDLAQTYATFLGRELQGAGHFLNWMLEPKTGRSHQLRFHLASNGFPIVGDVLYGSLQKNKTEGIALRATSLHFDNCLGADNWNLPLVIKEDDGN